MATKAEPYAGRPTGGARPTERFPIVRVRDGAAKASSDLLAAEEPLEIRLDGERVAVTMRTPSPGRDAELAFGFLLGEAIVAAEDVARISECTGGSAPLGGSAASPQSVDVRLWPGSAPAEGWQRNFYASSSCGICGKASIDAVRLAAEPVPDGPVVESETLSEMPEALRAAQRGFERTGGIHAAGLFNRAGAPLIG